MHFYKQVLREVYLQALEVSSKGETCLKYAMVSINKVWLYWLYNITKFKSFHFLILVYSDNSTSYWKSASLFKLS